MVRGMNPHIAVVHDSAALPLRRFLAGGDALAQSRAADRTEALSSVDRHELGATLRARFLMSGSCDGCPLR